MKVLKRITAVFVLITILILPVCVLAYNGDTIVYVTRTGEKYHRGSCGYLHSSKIEMTLQAAVDAGYTPCSRCSPPILSGSPDDADDAEDSFTDEYLRLREQQSASTAGASPRPTVTTAPQAAPQAQQQTDERQDEKEGSGVLFISALTCAVGAFFMWWWMRYFKRADNKEKTNQPAQVPSGIGNKGAEFCEPQRKTSPASASARPPVEARNVIYVPPKVDARALNGEEARIRSLAGVPDEFCYSNSPPDVIVYISPNDSYYHKAECYVKDAVPVSIADPCGRTPCPLCSPGECPQWLREYKRLRKQGFEKEK